MGAMSSIVPGMALGALGWRLSVSRWRGEAWVGAIFIAAAVCCLLNGTIAGLGRAVALIVITASGLLAVGVRLLFAGSVEYRPLALAILAAGAALAASGVFAVIEWGW